MKPTNRGDVPAPHVAPGQTKNGADPADDVVFDAGSLSFVQDWVVDDADSGNAGAGAAGAVEVEPERQDPRQSNPNRRLGVGAQPKKSKQERPEPSAFEKKMLRKRQRQEVSDAIKGEMDTHGVVDGGNDEDGESKTASFKNKKKKKGLGREEPDDATVVGAAAAAAATAAAATTETKDGEDETAGNTQDNEGGENRRRKRKARRKKNMPAEEVDADAAVAEIPSQTSTTVVEQQSSVVAEKQKGHVGGKEKEAEPGETKKQRRGWGKPRSKSAADPSAEGVGEVKGATGEERGGETAARERRPRKKTRSKQKNIRKDKRSAEERPAHLRAGDPEFRGRGLTDETRKFLGLPAADGFGIAPPAGWGKPGETWVKPDFLSDKKPRRLPKSMRPGAGGGENSGSGDLEAVQTDDCGDGTAGTHAERGAASTEETEEAATPSSVGKRKRKNLTSPPDASRIGDMKRKRDKRNRTSSGAAAERRASSTEIEGAATPSSAGKRKSKYKNLGLPPDASRIGAKKHKRDKRNRTPSGAAAKRGAASTEKTEGAATPSSPGKRKSKYKNLALSPDASGIGTSKGKHDKRNRTSGGATPEQRAPSSETEGAATPSSAGKQESKHKNLPSAPDASGIGARKVKNDKRKRTSSVGSAAG